MVITWREMIALQLGIWLGVFLLRYLMRRERYEPVPGFVQVIPPLAGFLLSGLLLLLWALA